MRHPYAAALPPVFLLAIAASAQTPPAPEPDTLLLNDGEKLIGHLVRSTAGSVRFKSDVLGDVNVDWSKIKELHAAGRFAVVPKNVRLTRKSGTAAVPEGSIAESDQKIDVSTAAGTKTVPVDNVAQVLDVRTFEKEVAGTPGFFHDWHGAVTAGASIVAATQSSRTFTESVSLVRAIPDENWLARRNRTTFDFTSAYGHVSQPATPSVKTSIYHVAAERDEYFSASMFGFGQVQYDHNFSQGLDLQQAYIGGIGWSIFKRPGDALDIKGGFSYIRQQFAGASASKDLASSVFEQKYLRKFLHGTTFTEQLGVSPAWTERRALSAQGLAALAIPVYKRFSFTTGVTDTFLNDPPPGFKKNSIQFTTGLTYVLP